MNQTLRLFKRYSNVGLILILALVVALFALGFFYHKDHLQLTGDVDSQSQTINDLQGQVDDLQRQNEDLNNQIDGLNGQISDMQNQITDLSSSVTSAVTIPSILQVCGALPPVTLPTDQFDQAMTKYQACTKGYFQKYTY